MDETDSGLAPRGRALSAIALLLLLRGLWPAQVASAPCTRAVSAEMREGRTTVFRCDDAAGPALVGPVRLLFGRGIDPNTVDAATLEVLPGIGAGRAEAIVRARAQGRFQRPEDLARVPGIGGRTVARFASWLEFPTVQDEPAAEVDPPGHGK